VILLNESIMNREKLHSLMTREQQKFVDGRPKSKALFDRARKSLLGGVPMNWMASGPVPFLHSSAKLKAPISSTWMATATSISALATQAP